MLLPKKIRGFTVFTEQQRLCHILDELNNALQYKGLTVDDLTSHLCFNTNFNKEYITSVIEKAHSLKIISIENNVVELTKLFTYYHTELSNNLKAYKS